MTAYYNEFDKHAAQWLRELIAEGHIAPGDVDERDIQDVLPSDLAGYTQCHFFAGVGVWSYALRCAGWDDSRPVWTGSCPCQPFSAAGKGAAFDDERHLWPAFHHLIEQRRPAVVFGEQVASKDGLAWLDIVHADLEGTGYAVGAVDLCSAGVGAPHIRQRLYWVADSDQNRLGAYAVGQFHDVEHHVKPRGRSVGMGNASDQGLAQRVSLAGVFSGASGTDTREAAQRAGVHVGGLADASSARHEQEGEHQCGSSQLPARPAEHGGMVRPGPTNGFWRAADWLGCRDDKWRPVEPGYEQMADGSAGSLGRVRASDIKEIEREINEWSIRHQADAREALCRVWSELSAEALCEREIGRFSGVRAPTILLAFVRQLTAQGWGFSDALGCSRSKASEVVLRVLRLDSESSCAPLQRELAGQLPRQSPDPLCELSQILASFAEQCWGDACRKKAGAASFPLMHGAAARVVKLRGYGNAINAEAAKAFIGAFMECRA